MKKMTKTAVALLLALTALLSCAAFAQAADSSVIYDGNAQDFIFAPGSDYSPTDLFPDFKGLLPGDTLTQKITVKNDASKAVKVRIYLRSLGAQEGSEELLSYLKLTVTQDGSTKLFEAPAAQTAQLTDWVSLGTLYSGGTADLEVKLEVSPELGNEFQDAIGYLDWEFKVEELPISPSDPKTGDETPIALYAAALSLSAVGAAALLVLLRKKKAK